MGLPSPYSESKPLKIETLELNKPNQNEVLIKIGRQGYVTQIYLLLMVVDHALLLWHLDMKRQEKLLKWRQRNKL